MKKLIKINTDHYVIVDDSEIKEGDYIYSFSNNKVVVANKLTNLYIHSKKITHSTEPLYKNDFWAIQELKLSEVKELIGEVDVEKKAVEWYNGQAKYDSSFIADPYSWKEGYNQALEDNKEKKYTEEDLRKAIQLAWEADSIDGTVDLNIVLHYGDNNDLRTKWSEDEIIKSLQPKTSWEVEIVDGKLKLKL